LPNAWYKPFALQSLIISASAIYLICELCLLGAVAMTWWLFQRMAYCEDCRRWLDLKRNFYRLPWPSTFEMNEAMQSGDLAYIAANPSVRNVRTLSKPYIKLNYVLCDRCGNCGVYQISTLQDEESNNSSKEVERPLSPMIELDPASAVELAQISATQRIVISSGRPAPVAAQAPAAAKPGTKRIVRRPPSAKK